jgi:hypothetical protein
MKPETQELIDGLNMKENNLRRILNDLPNAGKTCKCDTPEVYPLIESKEIGNGYFEIQEYCVNCGGFVNRNIWSQ